MDQDAGFGIRQIVDIALKALSPGVNDATTAVICIDYLGAILTRLVLRGMPPMRRLDGGVLRLIARAPTFASLLDEAFDQIRQCAEGNSPILARQLRSLETIAAHTTNPRRRQALQRHAQLIAAVASRTVTWPADLAVVTTAATAAQGVLREPSRGASLDGGRRRPDSGPA